MLWRQSLGNIESNCSLLPRIPLSDKTSLISPIPIGRVFIFSLSLILIKTQLTLSTLRLPHCLLLSCYPNLPLAFLSFFICKFEPSVFPASFSHPISSCYPGLALHASSVRACSCFWLSPSGHLSPVHTSAVFLGVISAALFWSSSKSSQIQVSNQS